MKVKITLEYEKEVDLPDKELWQVYRRSEWVAGVVEALERLDYTQGMERGCRAYVEGDD